MFPAFNDFVSPEEKRNAPNCAERDQNINQSADYRRTSAERPCDTVKSEKPDKSPVQTAY